MRILVVPLDERPCNYIYPQLIAAMRSDIETVLPPPEILGDKKIPAQLGKLHDWFLANIDGCDAAIVSMDMFLYGSMIAARLHHDSIELLRQRLEVFKEVATASGCRFYLHNVIFRTPAYDSADEEPDYYDTQGVNLYKYGQLTCKEQRGVITESERDELGAVKAKIPAEVLDDYLGRRRINAEVNKLVIDLVRDGYARFLTLPQGDCSEYDFTAQEQAELNRYIAANRQQSGVFMYPGTDEAACTLLARAVAEYYDAASGNSEFKIRNSKFHDAPVLCRKRVFAFYSSTLGAEHVPLYEERPFHESVKAHVLACGAILVDSWQEADMVLAVNSPGKLPTEAPWQQRKDITFSTYRCLREFVTRIDYYMQSGKPVTVADIAFANGGDTELVEMLDDYGLWDQITAYSGWNTACNSLGTALPAGLLALNADNAAAVCYQKAYHILEDWAYQAVVRTGYEDGVWFAKYDANWFDLKGRHEEACANDRQALLGLWAATFRNSFKNIRLSNLKVWRPWKRMFEIGLDFELKGTLASEIV